MFEFLAANAATIVVGLVVFAVIAAAVYKMIHDRKTKKFSCGGGCACCSGCPGAKTYRQDQGL